ncbi:MAG TPA: hypothetical protein OQH54_01335 [Nitrosopumilus sp.]|nr:hypothetical protein [Thermoproteota archaeon]HJJ22349.1 hypothetical protein [Nitrosopumilus sp.]
MDSDDVSKMFQTESEKLENLISNATAKSELSVHEIIKTYYQIMNVSSMITMLKPQIVGKPQSFLDKIQETEKIISEKFNSNLHPQIIEQLANSIQNTTKNLQSDSTGEKSKQDIENESNIYEELRQKMSTKEFVEQYDKGLSHD